ncbi:MAG: transposase [Thermoleophilia bacterium]|nr:transposase [Thermoleophilia bacterium]
MILFGSIRSLTARSDIRDLRKLTAGELDALRSDVLRQVGWGRSQAQVARQNGIHRVTLARWVRDAKRGTVTARLGQPRKLTAEHQVKIGDLLAGSPEPRTYLRQGDRRLWDAAALAYAIRKELDLDITPATVRQYLVRWGIAERHPVTVPGAYVCRFVTDLPGMGDLRRLAVATDSRGKVRFLSTKAADDVGRQLLLANLRRDLGYGRFDPVLRVAFVEKEPHELGQRLVTWNFGHAVEVLPGPRTD